MAGFLGLIVLAGLYFLPLIVALIRHHHNTLAVGVINFFLGWTLIGWVVALAMASTAVRQEPVTIARHVTPTAVTTGGGFCAQCGSAMPPGAAFCSSCGSARASAPSTGPKPATDSPGLPPTDNPASPA